MADIIEDARSLLESSGIIFIGRVGGRGLGLAGQILLVRSLSPENFGIIALGYTVILLLSRIYSVGLSQGVTRFLADHSRNEVEQGAIISSAATFIFLMTGIAGIGIFVGRRLIADVMGSQELAMVLLLFIPVLVFFPFSRLFLGILRAEGKSIPTVLSKDLLSRVIAFAGFLVLTSLVSPYIGAITYWNGIAFSMCVLTGLASFRYLRNADLRWTSIQSETFGSLWAFSWPLIISTSFAMFLSYVDIIMIGYFLSERDVGLYRAIQPLRQVTLFLLTSIVFLYLPICSRYFDRDNYTRLNELYTTATKWVTLGTFPFVVVFAMYSSDVIRVFFNSAYTSAAPTLSILIVGMFLRAVVGPTGETLKAINQTRIELYASLAGLIINIIINIILIPTYGIIGAAIGATFGFLAFNAIELYTIYQVTGGHPFTLNTAKPLVVAIPVSCLIWIPLGEIRLGLFMLIGIGFIMTIVMIIAVPLTQSFDNVDIELITTYRSHILQLVDLER